MANGVFNIAKGHVNEYLDRIEANDPANSAFIVVLLQVAEADATLEDYDTLDALLVAAGNTEANFTSYGRKTLTDVELTASSVVDDTNNWKTSAIPNQTWTAAGNGTNNPLVKLLVCYDSDTTGGTDVNVVPLTHHDFVLASTNGGDVTADLSGNSPAQAFFKAQN